VLEESLKSFLRAFDDDRTTRYVAAFPDLNGDGVPEAIVYLVSNGWCGSGGCNMLVLQRDGDSWKIVANVSVPQPPIRVLPGTAHSWHSIGVWVQGGGIQPGYEVELPFDGASYPRNPTVLPARKLERGAEGEVVIASTQNAASLYGDRTAGSAQERIRASFDCSKAATPIEKLICRDAELASMDRGMAAAYASMLQKVAPGSRDSLRHDQIQWFVKYRAACNAVLTEEERKGCIVRYLSGRTEELRAKAH
jgi:uncharacterized protein YecT (DUF1311 family)